MNHIGERMPIQNSMKIRREPQTRALGAIRPNKGEGDARLAAQITTSASAENRWRSVSIST